MVFVFIEDGTLDVIKDIEEARKNYEGIDVESGVYTFYDEKGVYLRPHFTVPNRHGKCLWVISWVTSGVFDLVPEPAAQEDTIAVALAEVQVLNANPYFKTLDEVKAYFSSPSGEEGAHA